MNRNMTELDVGDRLLLSVAEAAALCGVSRATIFKYLAVVPLEVANAADGWPVAEGAVGALLVVVVEPVWQGELARALLER